MDGYKFLQCSHAAEFMHCALSASKGQMTVFYAVIAPSAHLTAMGITKNFHCGGVGSQPIGNNHIGRTVVFQGFFKEFQCGSFVPGFGDERFQNLVFMVNRAPQPVRFPVYFYAHFVEMPTPAAIVIVGNTSFSDRVSE